MTTASTLKLAGRLFLAALGLLLLAQQKEAMGDVFADFVAIDLDQETAMGELNGVGFILETTRAIPTLYGTNGGVEELDETSTLFDSADFTPPLAMGDVLRLGASSDFRITFADPVSDLTLHIAELASNRLDFTSNGTPAQFSLLSSDGFLAVLGGGTAILGMDAPAAPLNASGSLLFSGTFSELSWTSNSSHTGDALFLQMSVVPEPSALALLSIAALGGLYLWRRRGV